MKYKKHNPSKINSSNDERSHRLVFFRIGPLRFGVHGVAGIFGTAFVSYGLYLSHFEHPLPFSVSAGIVISTLTNAIGSYGILSQVPVTSCITSWIFPPHKEAFKRTISIVGYLNLRLIHHWKWIWKTESLFFPVLLFIYTNYNFFPTQFYTDYSNGNTWVFVIPMFVGFNIDSTRQFPILEIKDTVESSSITSFSSVLENLNWDNVHQWNLYTINETYLLLTLFSALQVAFMFTLAFRGRMSIKSCYWIAALVVGLLCIRLFHHPWNLELFLI